MLSSKHLQEFNIKAEELEVSNIMYTMFFCLFFIALESSLSEGLIIL